MIGRRSKMTRRSGCLPLAAIRSLTVLVVAFLIVDSSHSENDAAAQGIADEFKVDLSRVRPSPIAGLYEITIGIDSIYVTPDAKFLISGDIVNATTGINVSEARRRQVRSELVSRLTGSVDALVFSPASVRHTITAFVDVDCALCRKLHGDVQALLARGIEVRYVFYPGGDAESASWKTTKAVWCAADRNSAFTFAMRGQPISSPAACEALRTLDAHRTFAESMGVIGTPTIVDSDGHMILGYRNPEILEAGLGLRRQGERAAQATD